MCGEVGRHLIEGIADGFVPGIFARHRHLIDEIAAVDSDAGSARWPSRSARSLSPSASAACSKQPGGAS